MVAILRGLGYAGAYLSGSHQADTILWTIRRLEAIASRWEDFAEELNWGAKGGFYLYESAPAQRKGREFVTRVLDRMSKIFQSWAGHSALASSDCTPSGTSSRVGSILSHIKAPKTSTKTITIKGRS
jgi:hypothetical protein